MEISWRNKAGFWLRSRKIKSGSNNGMMTLGSNQSNVKNILILLPRSPVAVRIVKYFLKAVSTDSAYLHFICFESVYDAFEPSVRENLILFKESDLDFWGLPSEEYIGTVFSDKYTAIVNLDPQFDPVMSSFMINAPVPIRIGFNSENSEILYNNLLSVSKNSGFLESGYLSIKKLLGL